MSKCLSHKALILLLLVSACSWRFRDHLLAATGRFLIVSDPLEQADVIVVLGGDFWGPRVLLGADLGGKGLAPRVLLSGPPYHHQFESDLARDFLLRSRYPVDMVVGFRHRARNTLEEAFVLRPVLDRLGAHRVLLVTSAYHSRRALWVFRAVQPHRRFQVAAAADHQFTARRWWQSEQQRRIVLREYTSMLGALTVMQWRIRFRGLPQSVWVD